MNDGVKVGVGGICGRVVVDWEKIVIFAEEGSPSGSMSEH